MGLFNDVVVADGVELPQWCGARRAFQTKDEPCGVELYLNRLEITTDGHLTVARWAADSPPPVERLPFHGILNFYTLRDSEPNKEWWEYEAKFTDGELVGIRLIDGPAQAAAQDQPRIAQHGVNESEQT